MAHLPETISQRKTAVALLFICRKGIRAQETGQG